METELCLSLDAENRSEYENFEDEEEIKLFLNGTHFTLSRIVN